MPPEDDADCFGWIEYESYFCWDWVERGGWWVFDEVPRDWLYEDWVPEWPLEAP